MSNEIDSSMKLLPYVDDKFVGYRNKSVQDFRFALSEGIRSQVFFATFVEKVENQIKSISVINASKLFLHRSKFTQIKIDGIMYFVNHDLSQHNAVYWNAAKYK